MKKLLISSQQDAADVVQSQSVETTCEYDIVDTISSDAGINVPYNTPTPGEIPIVGFHPFANMSGDNHSGYSDMVECGFNTIGCFFEEMNPLDEILSTLSLANRSGLKVILNGWKGFRLENIPGNEEGALSGLRAFIERLKTEYAVAGWYFDSDVAFNQLKDLKDNYKAIADVDDNHFLFTSLETNIQAPGMGICQYVFPEEPNSTETTTDNSISEESYALWNKYKAFLTKVQQALHPSMLSFQYYPFVKRALSAMPMEIGYVKFHSLMSCFKERATRTKRPFWFIVKSYFETAPNVANALYDYPFTELSLRYLVFCALAYGAQGIAYSKYWTNEPGINKALVNATGRHSERWKYVKTVNQEVNSFKDVFVNCEILSVRHIGTALKYGGNLNDEPAFCTINREYEKGRYIEEEIGPLTSASSIDPDGKGFMLSFLRNGTENYVVIINHDLSQMQSINLTFIPNCVVKEITPCALGMSSSLSTNNNLTRQIAAGNYVIYKWQYF